MSDKHLLHYAVVLQQLKEKIKTAQVRALLTINNELLNVYWEIGSIISEQEKQAGWGNKIVERLATDLKIEFPDMQGFSARSLRYMRDFSEAYPNYLILQQAAAKFEATENQFDTFLQQFAAKLPWGHHQVLLARLRSREERCFYMQKCAQNGWSRNMLNHQIDSGLHKRQGALTSNFKETLPVHQSELTQQLFKDPYHLDFIMLGETAMEKDLENALIDHITRLLLELGDGFAFMGRQRKLEAGDKEFFIDLLFYHTRLYRYIVIELKIGDFEPEYVSKMNLYLGLADDQLRREQDQPSIGLILCKTKNKIVAEYALRDISKPIGIAEYKIAEMLPEDIKGELPSIAEIEAKLDEEIQESPNPVDSRLQLIREKLKAYQGEEMQTGATYELLVDLFDKGLKPLFQKIVVRMQKEFSSVFMQQSLNWNYGNHSYKGIDELEREWKKEENLKTGRTLIFEYHLHALRKAGADNQGAYLRLIFIKDEYWYGFQLTNYNNSQAFFRRMYHQPLTEADMTSIINVLITSVLDRIEEIMQFDDGNMQA